MQHERGDKSAKKICESGHKLQLLISMFREEVMTSFHHIVTGSYVRACIQNATFIISSIVACVFVIAITLLPGRCPETPVSSGSTVDRKERNTDSKMIAKASFIF